MSKNLSHWPIRAWQKCDMMQRLIVLRITTPQSPLPQLQCLGVLESSPVRPRLPAPVSRQTQRTVAAVEVVRTAVDNGPCSSFDACGWTGRCGKRKISRPYPLRRDAKTASCSECDYWRFVGGVTLWGQRLLHLFHAQGT